MPSLRLARNNPRVLFLMAAPAEYGPALRSVIRPGLVGIGPVEAAVHAAVYLGQLAAGAGLPDLVVSLGSAGSRRLEHAQVYQASSVAYRDLDASAFGFEPGTNPLLDHPAVIELPILECEVPAASLSTGAAVVSGPAYDGIAADMVDMETYAVWRACQRFGVPMLGLRGISDGRADLQGLHDWTVDLDLVAVNLQRALAHIEAALGGWRQVEIGG